jgi:hypothetical protein
MAVVVDRRNSSRRARRVDAAATPAAANAPRDHGPRQTKLTTSSSPRTPRQGWDALKAAERAGTAKPGLVSENAAEQELDILMLALVYRVERVRALGYGAGLVGQEPDGSIEKRLLPHPAAHGDLPKARQPSGRGSTQAGRRRRRHPRLSGVHKGRAQQRTKGKLSHEFQ